MSRLPPLPELNWTEDGAPRALAFDDVYFSRAGGLAESEAVFLAGCGLPEAWRDRNRFAICELGFGSGLNVVAAWRAWRRTRMPHAILHMCSVEAFPMQPADAARALAAFPEAADLAASLLECWPVRAYAPQRLWFPDDGFALTLWIGEAESVLANIDGSFDAFFLDGFAPARNGAMWSVELMREIARLSAPGARLATFSVAGAVRRNLEASGFAVEKKPGFGAKRERLEAWRPTLSLAERVARDSAPGEGRNDKPTCEQWNAPHPLTPSPQGRGGIALYPYAACCPKRVAILGAGIAGGAVAHALARRGVEVIALDAAPCLGAGASGNPAALVAPRLDRGGALREFFLASYLDAIALYGRLGVLTRCGIVQRADARAAETLADLLADPPLPPNWFSATEDGAALHPRAGLVDTQAALAQLFADAQLMLEAPVAELERAGESWLLRGPDGRALLKADAVVLACGAALKSFQPASFLPIELSRGQIEWGPIAGEAPKHALTGGHYVAPFADGVMFGATFDRIYGPPAPPPTSAVLAGEAPAIHNDARARNLAALAQLAPDLARRLDTEKLTSRAALRATTPDRAPIAGLLPDAPAWLAQNAAIARGGEGDPNLAPPAHAGVYVLGGLGARGFTHAPLLGERLAAEMFGEPQALSSASLALLHPARFLHRALKRGG